MENINRLQVGDLVDMYFVSSKGDTFKDIGIINSKNSIDILSILTDLEMLEHLVTIGFVTSAFIKSRKKIFAFKDINEMTWKKHWPVFFEKFLKRKKEEYKNEKIAIKELRKDIKNYFPKVQLGKSPKSTDIYDKATDELWIIRTTFSEGLDQETKKNEGLSKLIKALIKNKDLIAKVCLADPFSLLNKISEDEIKGIYNPIVGWKIQNQIIQNSYSKDRITKFLYPYNLDYIRKLNDMYAALNVLNLKAKEYDVQDRLEFHTYTHNQSLRGTFIIGESNIVDFLYVPEYWIGMTGTLCRCEVEDDTPIREMLFYEAIEERKKMNITKKPDLITNIKAKLCELLKQEKGSTYNLSSTDYEKTIEERDIADEFLRKKSNKYDDRNKFNKKIDKFYNIKEKKKSENSVDVILIPHI